MSVGEEISMPLDEANELVRERDQLLIERDALLSRVERLEDELKRADQLSEGFEAECGQLRVQLVDLRQKCDRLAATIARVRKLCADCRRNALIRADLLLETLLPKEGT